MNLNGSAYTIVPSSVLPILSLYRSIDKTKSSSSFVPDTRRLRTRETIDSKNCVPRGKSPQKQRIESLDRIKPQVVAKIPATTSQKLFLHLVRYFHDLLNPRFGNIQNIFRGIRYVLQRSTCLNIFYFLRLIF